MYDHEDGYRVRSDASTVRRTLSAPLRYLLNRKLLKKHRRTLHLGAGRPNNPDRRRLDYYGAHHYDPNFGPTSRDALCGRDFDAVFLSFVLNVLQPQHRAAPLQDAASSLATDGTAYIAVRADKDVDYAAKRSGKWLPEGAGFLIPVSGGEYNFQQGYNVDALRQELVPWFREVDIHNGEWFLMAQCRGPYRTTPDKRAANKK